VIFLSFYAAGQELEAGGRCSVAADKQAESAVDVDVAPPATHQPGSRFVDSSLFHSSSMCE
jgi:hypothetical protein